MRRRWNRFVAAQVIVLLLDILVLLLLLAQHVEAESDMDGRPGTATTVRHSDYAADPSDDVCGLWMAPSTIPGAGWGLFAGMDYATNDVLSPGRDVVVAISDYTRHNARWIIHHVEDADADATERTTHDHGAPRSTHVFSWDDYTWSADFTLDPEGYHEVQVASSGLGAVTNSFLALVNVQWHDICRSTNTSRPLHRARDPGAGASTLYHRHMTARHGIAAGTELFIDYGDDWFVDRTVALGPVPLAHDLESATALVHNLTRLYDTWTARGLPRARDMAQDLWTWLTRTTRFASRILAALPRHMEWTTLHTNYDGNVTRARLAQSRRRIEWLQKHGACGDHLVAASSTLPQAGMGAMARRRLGKGTIVALLPLLYIPHRRHLDMYAMYEHNGDWYANQTETALVGRQLLLNYCFGHDESTLLLCPYGPMTNYINHNQTMANVKLQWAPRASPNDTDWRHATMDALNHSTVRAPLALELVATRDIAEGEEIWLDYGDAWEAAWHAHVSTWRPVDGAATHHAAVHWDADPTVRLHTVFDELVEPTYTNSTVDVMCDISGLEQYTEAVIHDTSSDDESSAETAIWSPCFILDARLDETDSNGHYLYTVHMYEVEDGTLVDNVRIPRVPRRFIHFLDQPGTSDTFLPNAFRHDMRIPDDMFPMAWRNLPKP